MTCERYYHHSIMMLVAYFLPLFAFNVKGDFELTLLHTNDVHSRIEEFNEYVGKCDPRDKGSCFGGMARLYTAIEKVRRNNDDVILLDAGDQFMGTLWYKHYKGAAAAKFMNVIKYDAMTLGNHEFDNGPGDIQRFIKTVNFPVVTSNVDFRKVPGWPAVRKFNMKSTVVEVKKKKIGVIGFTTPATKWLSSPGPYIKFIPILNAVRREVKRLKRQGVDILIGLSHTGLQEDIDVIKKVKDLDIIVGGHSHTFLYTGKPPSVDIPRGPYPVVISDSTKRLVLQAYAHGKYLGYLKVKFDDKGRVKSWKGNPILLDPSVPQNKGVLKVVKRMSVPIKNKIRSAIGSTKVPLIKATCRVNECRFGNLIADAMIFGNDVKLVFWNSGSIRASIVKKDPSDQITHGELYEAIPFPTTADTISLRGRVIKKVFEHSASGLPSYKGKFLQVSGFRVTYNITLPVGQRVVQLEALCSSCTKLVYNKIEDTTLYHVVTSNYLIDGGDGFIMLKQFESRSRGEKMLPIVEQYFQRTSPVSPKIEGRIRIIR